MHGLNPFVERPEELEARSWTALAVSATLHTLLMLWLVLRPVTEATSPGKASEEGQARQPIALPRQASKKAVQPNPLPTPQQTPQPAPPPAPPPPPTRETPLGPDSKNPDALVPKEAGPVKPMTEPEPTPKKSVEDPGQAAEKPPDPAPPAPPAPQAARRIPRAGDLAANNRLSGSPTSPWGPTSPTPLEATKGEGATAVASAPAIKEGSMGRVGQSGADTRDWRPAFEEAAGRCVAIPDLGSNADGTPVLATVIGRVLQPDGRSPLGGAHLQIIGTPFSTFSDPNGEYRLEFDPKLLEQCRVQYVRVVANGYQGAMLTLSIGERVRSDDVVLRRD